MCMVAEYNRLTITYVLVGKQLCCKGDAQCTLEVGMGIGTGYNACIVNLFIDRPGLQLVCVWCE